MSTSAMPDATSPGRARASWFDSPHVGRGTLFAILTLFSAVVAFAGDGPDTASIPCTPTWRQAATAGRTSAIDVSPNGMRVGDHVCVRIAVADVRTRATGPTDGPRASSPPRQSRRWHLLLNGLDAAQATGPEAAPGSPSSLSFALPAPTSASAPTADLIAALWTGGLSRADPGTRPVVLQLRTDAIGRSPGYELLRRGPVALRIFDPRVASGGAVLLIAFAAGIVWLARNTGLLRDADVGSPSSLARTQMAFWFALTVAGFCYVWLLTGVWRDVMTPATLMLLGISTTTGLGATAISSPKSSAGSAGFLLDVLSDRAEDGKPAGVEVHRLIMATWTLVLGGVFASTVLWTERFPSFDPVLLTLIGLASGVYVGFKWLGS